MRPLMHPPRVRAGLATLIAGLVGTFLPPGPSASAADYDWNNAAGGVWNVGGNWAPFGPPTFADTATIATPGAYTVALNDPRAITGLTMNNPTATLSHTAGTLEVGSNLALTAGTYSLNGGTITGGSITGGGGRLLPQVSNANFLTDVAVGAGVIDFSVSAARLRLRGTTTLAAGTVITVADGGGIGAVLAFEQTTTANGLTVNLGPNTYLTVEGNNTLTLGPTTTVTSNSNFAGSGGMITGELFVGGTTAVINQGLIRNTGLGPMTIGSDTFTNQAGGTVRAQSASIFIPNATNLTNFAESTLTGGTWEVRGTATLDFNTRSIATLAAGTTVVFDGTDPTFAALNALTTNNGTLRVLGGKTFTPTAASVNNAGTLEVGAASTFGKEINVQSGGRLEGTGTVTGAVTVGGVVAPGTAAAPVGTLTTGDQTWAGGGVYEISYGKVHGVFTAGTDNDYLTSAAGALAVTATPGNKFLIRMHYTGTDPTSDPEVTIKIATFGGGVPATFDLSAFQLVGDLAIGGSAFQLTSIGNDVFLTFTPVPEPGTVLLIGAAVLSAARLARRGRRTAAPTPG